MIAFASGARVWLATGHVDMRKGFGSLALLVQETLKRDPHAGDLYVFRGRRGDLIKIVWHDGQGACLFTKRLERGRFIWPSVADGAVTISAAQLSYLLSGIDWRMPQETWRPNRFGPDADPPDWHPAHQHVGESGTQHRPGPVCGRGGTPAALALLGRSDRRSSRRRLALPLRIRSQARRKVSAAIQSGRANPSLSIPTLKGSFHQPRSEVAQRPEAWVE